MRGHLVGRTSVRRLRRPGVRGSKAGGGGDEEETRWSRCGLALAVAVPLALAPAAKAQARWSTRTGRQGGGVGLNQPIAMAFLGRNDMLVLEKASGQVKRVVDGQVRDVVLDLAVNSASERGLLGIALHPNFRTQRLGLPVLDREQHGRRHDGLADVRLLGNRVDRFEWNGGRSSSTAISSSSAPSRPTPEPARCAATTTAA